MPARLSPITIVGAGLSGLCLGQCLKHKGIAAVIYDRAQQPPRYNYGITLHSSTYKPLLSLLGMEENAFIEKLAVDAQIGGNGNLVTGDGFRCHRGRLESLLREGLSIHWGHQLTEVQLPSEAQGECTTIFGNGSKVPTPCLISCEGPHSLVRKSLPSAPELEVLPYVTFRGTRRLDLDKYKQTLHNFMQGNALLQKNHGGVYLEVSIGDLTSSTATISYIYSRPGKEKDDPLYRPNRPLSGATEIPDEFFSEIEALSGLDSPFREIFDPESIREDRLLSWLMRSLTPNSSEARLSQNGIVLIGDAVHAVPILGGQGAQIAIQDSIALGEYISENGAENFEPFTLSRLELWKVAVADAKSKIAELHAPNGEQL